jgi:hypothetical protein
MVALCIFDFKTSIIIARQNYEIFYQIGFSASGQPAINEKPCQMRTGLCNTLQTSKEL